MTSILRRSVRKATILPGDIKEQYPVKIPEILSFLQTDQANKLCLGLYQGHVNSRRSEIIKTMHAGDNRFDFGIHSDIMKIVNLNFIENDEYVEQSIWKLLRPVFDMVEEHPAVEFDVSNERFRYQYAFYVLLPESLIALISKKYDWTKGLAESFYLDANSRVSASDYQNYLEEQDELEEEKKREAKRKNKKAAKERLESPYLTNDPPLEELPDLDEMFDLPEPDKMEVLLGVKKVFEPASAADRSLPTRRSKKVRIMRFASLLHYQGTV